jgi:hypothetical protein
MYHAVTQTERHGGANGTPDAVGQPGQENEEARVAQTAPGEAEARDEDGDAKDAKKERVLHTRVPAVLERELKRFAENLRIPVSNLVRTILEDALQVADAATESVEERLKRAAKHLEKEREKLKKRMEHDPLEGIEAFQEVTLAIPTTCAKCDRELARGTRAHLGILGIGEDVTPRLQLDRQRQRRFVCHECLPRG